MFIQLNQKRDGLEMDQTLATEKIQFHTMDRGVSIHFSLLITLFIKMIRFISLIAIHILLLTFKTS